MFVSLLHGPVSCFGGNVGNDTKCRWGSSVILLWHWCFLRRLACLFYFTLRCRTETEKLGELDLPDRTAARDEALRIAPAFRAMVIQVGGNPGDWAIEVSEQGHRIVCVVPL